MKLFRVWNSGNSAIYIVASDEENAKEIAVETRHVRKKENVKKIIDAEYLHNDLGTLLHRDKTGVVCKAINFDKTQWCFSSDEVTIL